MTVALCTASVDLPLIEHSLWILCVKKLYFVVLFLSGIYKMENFIVGMLFGAFIMVWGMYCFSFFFCKCRPLRKKYFHEKV